MFAIYDENPYPPGSVSYNIWKRNKERGTDDIRKASERDKFIMYLFIMGEKLVDISRIVGVSINSVNNTINKYHLI